MTHHERTARISVQDATYNWMLEQRRQAKRQIKMATGYVDHLTANLEAATDPEQIESITKHLEGEREAVQYWSALANEYTRLATPIRAGQNELIDKYFKNN